ncbi:putative ALA-interacting subunit 3 [Blattamonas nauphoetae]|uniref:ALA-interacting subunit 3 n=1 Tax=Blattamonas nauphoetae TaxID=2049346 RepID=A0ABQ9XJC9_9EUKA|nr:putative ALA-interacting subunit 3 [Blattamonas nauphoetae]
MTSEFQELIDDGKPMRKRDMFTQQQMPGLNVRLSPLKLIAFLLIVFLIFCGIGVPIILVSNSLYENVIPYHKEAVGPVSKTFRISTAIPGPIYVMYQLENFYQNHRRFVNSRSFDQLRGREISAYDLEECDPRPVEQRPAVQNPCGIAASMRFTDTYLLNRINDDSTIEPVTLDRTNLVWKSDKTLYKTDPNARFDVSDEDFIVWMKTAALPNFRKLYARLPNGLPAGNYSVEIDHNYIFTKGSKSVVFSQHSWFGGKNMMMGILFAAVGCLCFVLAIAIALKACICPRRFTLQSYQELMKKLK